MIEEYSGCYKIPIIIAISTEQKGFMLDYDLFAYESEEDSSSYDGAKSILEYEGDLNEWDFDLEPGIYKCNFIISFGKSWTDCGYDYDYDVEIKDYVKIFDYMKIEKELENERR